MTSYNITKEDLKKLTIKEYEEKMQYLIFTKELNKLENRIELKKVLSEILC